MADQQNMGGLSTAIKEGAQINPYGLSQERLQELYNAQRNAITALEQRYAQPNWFKVAAGFAKPQLGGFLASLGSAAEALGENVEQQRSQQLPLAQMKIQTFQTQMLMEQNKKAAEMVETRRKNNLPITPEFVSEVVSIAPESPVAKSLVSQLATQQKQQELFLQQVQAAQNAQMQLSPDVLRQLGEFGQPSTTPPRTTTTAPAGMPAPAAAPAPGTTGISAPEQTMLAGVGQGVGAPIPPIVPEQGVPAKEVQKYRPTIHVPSFAGMSQKEAEARRELLTQKASKTEGEYLNKFNSITSIATGPDFVGASSALDSVLANMRERPELAAKVFNIVRSQGPFVAAMAAGIGANVGGYGLNISLPAEAFLAAGLSPEEQQYADVLTKNLVQVAIAKVRAQGFDPAKTGQGEYMNALKAAAGLNQTPQAAFNILMKDKAQLDYNKELYDTILDEKKNMVDENSMTPFADIFQQSPRVRQLEKKYKEIYRRIDEDFRGSLRKKP